jgi:F0F1-type ATP synthase delta subunit
MSFACQPEFFNEVCHRYASVLYELPVYPTISKDLHAFLSWAKERPVRWSLLKEPELSAHWHARLLDSFYQTLSCHPMAKNVLTLLSHHRRMVWLPEILALVKSMRNPRKVAYLTISKKLSASTLNQLTQQLSALWEVPVTVHQQEEPALLLGGILLWDHYKMDASLSALLNQFQKETLCVLSDA